MLSLFTETLWSCVKQTDSSCGEQLSEGCEEVVCRILVVVCLLAVCL